MNNQKPEPRSKGEGHQLDFHSMFFTIQGEGPFAGHRSVFIRLAGCNLQCPGCDTEYTEGRELWGLDKIIGAVYSMLPHNHKGQLVVITGGEPLRQPIGPLVAMLIADGFKVQIESNGIFRPDDVLLDQIQKWGRRSDRGQKIALVVSPKTHNINPVTAFYASAFKYVLDHRSVASDGLPVLALGNPTKEMVARPTSDVPIYINPFDAGDIEENKKNLAAVARSCMTFGYIAGVQMHKLMDLE